MTTPVEWWERTRKDESRIISWLQRQHVGEMQASNSIMGLLFRFPEARTGYQKELADFVEDEARHARELVACLKRRGASIILNHSSRYWAQQPSPSSFIEACAMSAHAEALALVRIQVVADDLTAPWDIRTAFLGIAEDEKRHVELFRAIAGEDALESRLKAHLAGVAALGVELKNG